ncbi:protein artichoke [Sitodiplosis mosellana]|uniref:protein artichoke n=1 Tax=Sitodiplosis mosellana TaxID=263140 RepID=UPI002444491E|nr:protein artichoke [Sitodiplosis mosellana]
MDCTLKLITVLISVICIFCVDLRVAGDEQTLCPPQKLILPCRCAQKSNEIQLWCSHSDLPRVLNGIKSAAKFIDRPIDELILENNQLPSLPSRFFSPLRIVRLMLRNNGVERLATGWLNDLESSLVEIFIVERTLRSLPFDSLVECEKLQAVTIQSNHLKRAPSFMGLFNLRYIKIEGSELMEMPPYGFVDLHSLENVYISSSPKLNRLEVGVFQNLDLLHTLNVNGNGISWVHLRAFSNLPTLNSIDLSHNEISDAGMIGRAIKDLPKLEVLKLDRNFITTLSEGTFVDLEYLKELYLNDNSIAEIHHGAFHKMPRLKLLHLENNFLRRVHPESFLQTSGSGVEYLHLQYNEISNIEEVKSLLDALPMLKFLDLSYNKLETVPFGSLRGHGSLEQLCLDHNYISRIERDAFMAMPGLRELRLKNNSLTENTPLPFWNLPGLKGLDLSENNISVLNDTLLIGLPSLRRLDLSNNKLSEIDPASFTNNAYLETINISMNSLVELHPATLRFLNRLFEIDASYNELKEFIPGLPRIVERVNVEGNKITMLPSTSTKLLDLPNLRMLNMGVNLLNKIPKNAFSTLYQLRSLSLAQNRLRTIDEQSFAGLARLETLNLQENGLVAMHERGFSPLKDMRELNVQGNRLEILVECISENEQLEKFDASRNNIMEIAPQTFTNSRHLHSLDLSHNALKQLPQSLATLTELRDVDISFNRLTMLPSEIITAWRQIEILKASDNKLMELPKNTFTDLPKLEYLDLSSNELKIIDSGSMKNLPELQELVLADNQLAELGERSFEDLPNLQALHLQNNFLRYISPKSFYHTNSIVYLNLSYNNFDNMEHMGLTSVRDLEVLDLSGNKVRRIATNSLRNLDWLVELKMDDNHICKVQGEPFSSMPRLKVLTMRNNRMISVTEPTFRHLRGNLAVLDLDGNPLECSCNVLWLRAWYQETNSHPGPKCRDGNLLTDMRVSKSDCDASNDNRMNQVLLTNEHGDIFKRQLGLDECDTDPYSETEHIPASPIESEYFYEQFIDYPLNDSATEQSDNMHQSNQNQSPFSRNMTVIRNDTVLNYEQHKLQQLHDKNHGGSSFTFFGMPLPSISNLWSGGNTARKSTSRADVDANGKSRLNSLRNYRPRAGEIIDSFQFSNNIHLPQPPQSSSLQPQKPTPATLKGDKEPTNIHPPPPPNGPFPPPDGAFLPLPNGALPPPPPNAYHTNVYSDPRIEKGGFVPILPNGRKGFTPIQNPFSSNDTETEEDTGDVQETVSTELKPNVNLEFDDNLDYVPDNKYPVLVPTVSADPNQSIQNAPQSRFNVSSLKKGEIIAPTKSSNGISLIRSTVAPATSTIVTSKTTRRTVTELNTHEILPDIDRNGLDTEQAKRNIQKITSKAPKHPALPPSTQQNPDVIVATTQFFPTFMPNSSDVINLSKNRIPTNGTNGGNGIGPGSALSALVAPGAQQGIYRTPPGRSVITKVFNNTIPTSSFAPTSIPTQWTTSKPITTSSPSTTTTTTTTITTTTTTTTPKTTITTTKQPIAHKLPTAEEYLRTTSQDNSIKENTTPNSQSNKTPNSNDLEDQATQYKGDMNWYYSNYNRSIWKEPQLDSGLHRFRTHSGSSRLAASHFTIIIFTLILATTILDKV